MNPEICTRIADQNPLQAVVIMKRNLLVLFLLYLLVLSGCSVPGSANRPVEDDSVTLLALVSVPQIDATGLLAAIGEENNSGSWARFVASSTCKINGRLVEFSLNEQTREFKAEKIPPSGSYLIELTCGRFTLQSIVAHSSRKISLPRGLSLSSSADWHLRAALARLESLEIGKLSGYEIKPALIDNLVNSMQTELKRPGSSATLFAQLVENSVSAALAGKSFADCAQKTGTAQLYKGEYAGSVYYFALNSAGQPVLAVEAIASMTCNQSGNTVSGNFSITPTGVVPLLEDPRVSAPSKTAFSFSGTVNNSLLTFVRKGDNNGSPLSGKDIDSWFIFPVSDGLAVRASNLDKSYYSGIQSRSGEFILQKKK